MDLIDENVDCVIRGGVLTDPSLVARQIGELKAGLYAAPKYLDTIGVPTHPAELEADPHRIVGYRGSRPSGAMPYVLRRGDETLTIHGRHLLAVDDGNAYLAAGVAGLGVLWLPDYVAAEHERHGELVRVLTDWQVDPMPLHIAFRPNRHVSAKLRVFVDWVAALMAEHVPKATQGVALPGGQHQQEEQQ